MPLDTQEYWENHIEQKQGLLATGHRRFSLEYNQTMYQLATERLKVCLDTSQIHLKEKYILDVGCGYGYFTDVFIKWGAQQVTGIDIAPASISFLADKYPNSRFENIDVSSNNFDLRQKYDVIFAISVIFHIVDNQKFQLALENLLKHLKPKGFLILVDGFHHFPRITASHVVYRTEKDYLSVFRQYGIDNYKIHPMYYLFSQVFIPKLGPWVLNNRYNIKLLYRLEKLLDNRNLTKGFLNYLVVQKP